MKQHITIKQLMSLWDEGWMITYGGDKAPSRLHFEELCDALWEAVKEVLENEKTN